MQFLVFSVLTCVFAGRFFFLHPLRENFRKTTNLLGTPVCRIYAVGLGFNWCSTKQVSKHNFNVTSQHITSAG